jgi:hypothetical protein
VDAARGDVDQVLSGVSQSRCLQGY